MKFGQRLLDHHVSLIFGNGIFALRGDVIAVHDDYLEVREEKDGTIIHVPLASIVYARQGVKRS
jgi:signal peptidase I